MSTTDDSDLRDMDGVVLTTDQLWRLAAGESVRLQLDGTVAGSVEIAPPDPFDETIPSGES